MNPVKFLSDKIHTCPEILLVASLTKYLNIFSVQMDISNTKEYLFPIIYTCIYYNPPMNPYNLQQRFYPVGDTIALEIYLLYVSYSMSPTQVPIL